MNVYYKAKHMRNDIDKSPTHLIFKFIIRIMRFTSSFTNSMVDLKLSCIEMYKEYMCIIFLNILCKMITIDIKRFEN
jgi:hypothetical protein